MTGEDRGEFDMSWVQDLRAWMVKPSDPEKHYSLLLVLMRPDGVNVTALPGWSETDPVDEQALRADLYKAVDVVLDKRYSEPDQPL